MITRILFKKYLLQSLIINVFTALLKSVALYFYFSSALLTDSIHHWVVVVSQSLLRFGIGRGPVPRSRENPFGFSGRLYFFSFIATIMLLSGSGFYAISKGILDLHSPQQNTFSVWLSFLFLISVILLFFVILFLYRFCTRIRGSEPLFVFLKRSKRVDLVVNFLQQAALLTTTILMIVSIILGQSSQYKMAEGVGTILIGLVMLANALITGMKMQDMLIGESAELSINKRIYSLLIGEEWIVEIDSMQTLQLEDETILLVIKAECQEHLNSSEINTLVSGIEQDIRRDYPSIKRIYFESAPIKQHL